MRISYGLMWPSFIIAYLHGTLFFVYHARYKIMHPTTYENISAWAIDKYSTRLIILPRAKRSMATAKFKDVGMVCQCLELLANEYWLFRQGELPLSDWNQLLGSKRLRYGRAITPVRAGEEEKEYYVNYPPNNQQKRCLDLHIRNRGSTRNPARCLAIYFFWDEERKLVVVGSLPGHLSTRISN